MCFSGLCLQDPGREPLASAMVLDPSCAVFQLIQCLVSNDAPLGTVTQVQQIWNRSQFSRFVCVSLLNHVNVCVYLFLCFSFLIIINHDRFMVERDRIAKGMEAHLSELHVLYCVLLTVYMVLNVCAEYTATCVPEDKLLWYGPGSDQDCIALHKIGRLGRGSLFTTSPLYVCSKQLLLLLVLLVHLVLSFIIVLCNYKMQGRYAQLLYLEGRPWICSKG